MMARLWSATRGVAIFAFLCILSACGGGGGGGGPTSTGGPGGFTISATSETFQALQDTQSPPPQNITLTLTDTGAATVGAAFPAGQVPQWLAVNITGTAPNYTVTVAVTTTSLAVGHYTATLLLGTADQSQNVLQHQQVSVSYDIQPSIAVTPSVTNPTFVYGSSVTTAPLSVMVDAANKSWTITSTAPWLVVPTGTQQGSATLALVIDASAAQSLGTTGATLTIQDTANQLDRRTVAISYTVVAPSPTVAVNPVVLGSADGLGPLTQAMDVSIDTGTNTYPWTLTLSDTQSLGWLTSSAPSGTLGGSQHAAFNLGFNRSTVSPGRYNGVAKFATIVKGTQFSVDVPVTLNFESHRLFTAYNGVAFSNFPSRQVLTRSLDIVSSLGKTGVPWTAASDATWLHFVAASGVTGQQLQLTVDPNDSTVVANAINTATITLASSDTTIERSETIRVGLWVSGTDPTNVDPALVGAAGGVAVNPVEPLAYVADDGGNIHVYNIYTGALVTTFATGAGSIDALAISTDGRLLFVTDATAKHTLELNAATGVSTGTVYQTASPAPSSGSRGMVYTRPNGHPVLWTDMGEVFDIEAKAALPLLREGVPLFISGESLRRSASPDGGTLFTTSSIATDDGINRWSQRFVVLGQRGMEYDPVNGTASSGGQLGWDMCVSASGTRLAALGPQHLFSIAPTVVTGITGIVVPTTAAANAVACGADNRIYVGLTTFLVPQSNLYIFDADGNQIGTPQLSGPSDSGRLAGSLRISGDGTRVISLSTFQDLSRHLSLYGLP